MELIDEESLQPFKSLMDEYDQSFYTKNIDKFRSLPVSDNGVVFFDNHANCDFNTYEDHEIKVSSFFKTGEIGKLIESLSVEAEMKSLQLSLDPNVWKQFPLYLTQMQNRKHACVMRQRSITLRMLLLI